MSVGALRIEKPLDLFSVFMRERHLRAAQTHEDMARRHEEAALHWAEHAELERRAAEIERAAAQLERDRAELKRRNGGAQEKKVYPTRKRCTGQCGKTRVITKFRLLSSGYRQGMCVDCERKYERDRWHTRSPASKGQ